MSAVWTGTSVHCGVSRFSDGWYSAIWSKSVWGYRSVCMGVERDRTAEGEGQISFPSKVLSSFKWSRSCNTHFIWLNWGLLPRPPTPPKIVSFRWVFSELHILSSGWKQEESYLFVKCNSWDLASSDKAAGGQALIDNVVSIRYL